MMKVKIIFNNQTIYEVNEDKIEINITNNLYNIMKKRGHIGYIPPPSVEIISSGASVVFDNITGSEYHYDNDGNICGIDYIIN